MSTSTPVLDRVGARLGRLSMRADAVRLRLTRGVTLTERVEAESGDPEDWSFLRRPALLGLRRRPLHLRRRVAAELALQARDGRHVVLRRGRLAVDHADAARRRRRLRRHGPLRPRLVRSLPDAAGPPRRADPPAGLHAGPVDPAAPGGGPALQPGRVLLRRPGRDDEPPHQPVPLRAGHAGLGAVRLGGRSAVGEHARPVRAALLDAGRVVGLAQPSTTRCSPLCCCASSRSPASPSSPTASPSWPAPSAATPARPSCWRCSTR